jgi:hypothetical protein
MRGYMMEAIKTKNVDREEFIETLNEEFVIAKGYGVYAYLSAIDVIRLYEHFKSEGGALKSFIKKYVGCFNTFEEE